MLIQLHSGYGVDPIPVISILTFLNVKLALSHRAIPYVLNTTLLLFPLIVMLLFKYIPFVEASFSKTISSPFKAFSIASSRVSYCVLPMLAT